MAKTPKGSLHYIATAFGSDLTVTAASNASECQLTSTAHGLANGDLVEITSGWGRLHKRVAKVKSAATNTFVLDGFDTTNTNFFPAGSGTGSVRKITTWTQITKVLGISPSGGDPKPVSYSYQEDDVDRTINDGFTATNLTMEIDADAIGTAGYTALQTYTDSGGDTIIRTVLRDSSQILRPGTVVLNPEVILQDGQVNRVRCALSGNNRSTRYSS
jgi:hypothetical protein